MQRTPEPAQDTPMSVSAGLAPPEGAEKTKKRPRLDMAVEPRERKRGNVRARPMHADEDRKSTRLNSSHSGESRMPSSA